MKITCRWCGKYKFPANSKHKICKACYVAGLHRYRDEKYKSLSEHDQKVLLFGYLEEYYKNENKKE